MDWNISRPVRLRYGVFDVLLAVAWVLCVSACAARSVSPVAMTQPGDEQLSCAQLNEQLQANDQAALELLRQDKHVGEENIAKTVVGGVLVPIGLLIAMTADFSNEEQVKAKALEDRNERLSFLIRTKSCRGQ